MSNNLDMYRRYYPIVEHGKEVNCMERDDTIELLQECDKGIKTAVASIDELKDKVKDETLKKIFEQYKHDHEELGRRILHQESQWNSESKDPNPMVKAMSWMKINTMMLQNPTDHEAASLMMDGCNMGIKSVCKYQNKYKAASEEAKVIAKDLVDLEQKLMVELRAYL